MIDDYVCRDNGLHDYSITVGENDNLLVEQCVQCGHKIQFIKSTNGKTDNIRYGETHQRWFLQPNHPLYRRYYGKPPPPLPSKAEARKKAVEIAREEIERSAYET
jgi:Zn ribbon nucleic-acid-binding protein